MGLFIDNIATTRRPPVNAWAVTSLIVSATGFINIIGFFVGPVLAHIALVRLRRSPGRGRRLAIAALWVSYGTLVVAVVTLLVVLIAAYAALPAFPVPAALEPLPHINDF